MTRLAALREAAAPWLERAGAPVVDSPDRADAAVMDQVLADCTALAELDADLAEHYGAPGLVADLWTAAYSRTPHLAAAADVGGGGRARRAVAAAMLGTPEHDELRRATAGDPYAAAMAVLAQGPALRRMLRELAEAAPPARREADRAAGGVRRAYAAAAGSVGGEASGEVARPLVVDVQRAVAEAEGAAAEAAAHGRDTGGVAVARVRAAARRAAADAEAELAAETAATTAWGFGEGDLQRLDPDERMRLAAKLRGGKLAAFAELIGRFRQMAAAQRSRRVEHAKSEYVGVTLGDDLSALVPGEAVNLAVPALRAQFAIRYAEGQLMVYDQRGEDREAQGAVIACVDCSYSMLNRDDAGITGEAYAKALALALLDQAREARPPREFAAILFDDRAHPAIRFPAGRPVDLEAKLALAETFPGGGTDFAAPLDAALALLDAEYNTTGRQKADLVFITDGEAGLSPAWLDAWREKKRRLGFRCFGVSIGWWAEDATALDGVCDDLRRIEDLTDTHAAADLFRAV